MQAQGTEHHQSFGLIADNGAPVKRMRLHGFMVNPRKRASKKWSGSKNTLCRNGAYNKDEAFMKNAC